METYPHYHIDIFLQYRKATLAHTHYHILIYQQILSYSSEWIQQDRLINRSFMIIFFFTFDQMKHFVGIVKTLTIKI